MRKIFAMFFIVTCILVEPVFAFSDVSEDNWAYEKIAEMNRSGIISGFEDGTFKPNDPITREQAAAIVSNFFELTLKENANEFADVTDGYWSEKYINLAGQYMPVDNFEGVYYFRPFDNAKRIEIAETIVKIIGYDDSEVLDEVIEKFVDNDTFSEKDKKYISSVVSNNIMAGDDKSQFRPNDTITRAEFCALIYNIYLLRDDLKAQNFDKVLMTVNGEEVLYSEFNLYFSLQRKIYESMFGSDSIWTQEIDGKSLYILVKDATKDGMINSKLKVQNAKLRNIELTEEEKNELKDYANSDAGLELCEIYNITSEQLYDINTEGVITNKLAKAIYDEIDHTGHSHLDINASVDTVLYDARHILLSTIDLDELDKEEVKKLAENLLERVKNGEDFAKLAEEYSDDGGSKDNGGLYEDISIGEFVSEFEEAALSLNEGMIYPELVESYYGYHIIKLEGKEMFERELTDDEKQEIMTSDLEEVAEKWLENADVSVNEELYRTI